MCHPEFMREGVKSLQETTVAMVRNTGSKKWTCCSREQNSLFRFSIGLIKHYVDILCQSNRCPYKGGGNFWRWKIKKVTFLFARHHWGEWGDFMSSRFLMELSDLRPGRLSRFDCVFQSDHSPMTCLRITAFHRKSLQDRSLTWKGCWWLIQRFRSTLFGDGC